MLVNDQKAKWVSCDCTVDRQYKIRLKKFWLEDSGGKRRLLAGEKVNLESKSRFRMSVN